MVSSHVCNASIPELVKTTHVIDKLLSGQSTVLSISIRKFVLSSPRGGEEWAQETCAGAIKIQGPDRAGIVEGACGYRVRGVSIRRKFVLLRNLGYKTRGVAK